MHGILKTSVEVAGVVFLLLFTTLNATNQAVIDVKPIETSGTEQEEIHYLTQKELSLLYTCKDEPINDTCMVIDQEDAEMLMKIAVAEDHTDETSQAYVMSIILNRVDSPDFPDTVAEVIEQPGQFMKLTDKRYLNAEPDVNSHLALALIEGKRIETNFLYYEAKWVKNSWAARHREVALEYGGSRFYK